MQSRPVFHSHDRNETDCFRLDLPSGFLFTVLILPSGFLLTGMYSNNFGTLQADDVVEHAPQNEMPVVNCDRVKDGENDVKSMENTVETAGNV